MTQAGDDPAGAAAAMERKLVLSALKGRPVPRTPIWLMRQAGRYLPEYRATRAEARDFLGLCYTPELAVEVTLQPIRRFGFDAAILFSDIMVVPDALGQKVWFEEGAGPRLDALVDSADLDRLSFDRFEETLRPVYEAVAGIKAELDTATALIGFAGAPWTVASYMIEGGSSRDFVRAKSWAYGNAEVFQRLIMLLVDATVRHLGAQVAAGAEVVQLFDSWAGALPADAMRRWCLAPAQEVVRRMKRSHPEVPVILFPRGAGPLYRDFAAQTGADALSLDSTVPLGWARDTLQPRVALQGNLDPVLLVTGGAALEDAACAVLETLGRGPLVFNLGSGIIPEARPEHVADLVRLVQDWRS